MSLRTLLGTVASSMYISSGGGGTDADWKNVIGLWHADTSLENSAKNRKSQARTPTTAGAGGIVGSSPSPKFGAGSYYSSTANSDGGFRPPAPSDVFYFGNRNFTIELWAYRAANWSVLYRSMIGDFVSGIRGSWSLFCTDDTTAIDYIPAFLWVDSAGATQRIDSSVAMALTSWQHLAVVRNGTSLKMYLDGVQVASTTISASLIFGQNRFMTYHPWIARNNAPSDWWRGGVDDVRITRGVARYTSAFTPPIAAFDTGTFGGWSTPAAPTSLAAAAFTNLTPVAGWGTIKRNPSYSGPALRVADNTSAAETDVNFDAQGYVTGDPPYGENTRVVKVYDQWGTDHLTCVKAADICIWRDDDWYKTWRLYAPTAGTDALKSTKTTTSTPAAAWAISNMVWMCGASRFTATGLRTLWGVDHGTNYMAIGLWNEDADWHWRVGDGTGSDWSGTNVGTNYTTCGGLQLERLIGDLSAAGSGGSFTVTGYFNNVSAQSKSVPFPIVYPSAKDLRLLNGTTLNQRFHGQVTELHIFSAAAAMNSTERGLLDTAMQQALR